MAVIITDMDMPDSCYDCDMHNYHFCDITRNCIEQNIDDGTRANDCPLKSADKMISEIEDYNVRQNFDGRVTMEYMVGVTRGLDLSADIVHKYCDEKE